MIFVLLVAILIVCFIGVLLFGAPYLPTLTQQVSAALELANLQPGQTLIELGCGDGKILVAAAKRGAIVIGYELNPILALICWLRTRRFDGRVRIVCGDFWRAQWPAADVIFTFLLPKYMLRLDKKVIQYNHKPVKLVSFAFTIPNKKPTGRKASIFLYQY
jgi:16S rRNA A1518/A1519 N6-dimethyltransferase RsmA/KsgA/DIM1 with predicted DNA glycosylase/AP lyase activity